VEVVVPGPGRVADAYRRIATVRTLDFATLTTPEGPGGIVRFAARLTSDVRTFRAQIQRTRPARVVAVTATLPALLLAARAERVPRLVYAAEIVPTGPGLARRVGASALLPLTRRLADGLVCCSEAVAAQFRGPGAPPIEVAYPPIRSDNEPGDGAALRAHLGVDSGARCVAVIGNLSRGRGQDVLIRAIPALLERFPGLRVLIVGDPHPREADLGYRHELDQLARDLGIADVLTFTGFIDRIGDVYAAADAVAVPARREAFGRVAAEALVGGCPVVATAIGGMTEVLDHGVDALLIPPDDVEALTRALMAVLEDRALAARLTAAGAARVRRECSEGQSLERFAAAVWRVPRPAAAGRA
jgi:glycosyltransferase involved in cell wall biosynthesis